MMGARAALRRFAEGADGWIRIPVRKRINPCLDSIIALLYCCIQAIADNYSPKGLLANTLIAAWDAGVAFGIFFSALQRCVLPDFSQGLKEACCLVPPRSRKGMRCLALFWKKTKCRPHSASANARCSAPSAIEFVSALNIRACLCWNKMKKQAAGACLLLFDSRCFRTNHTKNFCCITESVCFQFVIVRQSTLFDAQAGCTI